MYITFGQKELKAPPPEQSSMGRFLENQCVDSIFLKKEVFFPKKPHWKNWKNHIEQIWKPHGKSGKPHGKMENHIEKLENHMEKLEKTYWKNY